MDTQIYRYMDTFININTQIHGHIDIYRYMDTFININTQIHGYIDIYRYMDTFDHKHKYIDTWIHRYIQIHRYIFINIKNIDTLHKYHIRIDKYKIYIIHMQNRSPYQNKKVLLLYVYKLVFFFSLTHFVANFLLVKESSC